MGIFLGASLLSLVELVEFCVLLLKSDKNLQNTETPPVQKGTMSLHGEQEATKCNPAQQQTGKGSKRVGNERYTPA
jgi:hypothetical protein